MIFSLVILAALNVHAEVAYYFLDNVILDDKTQMTGTFSWTYDTGDFENGVCIYCTISTVVGSLVTLSTTDA